MTIVNGWTVCLHPQILDQLDKLTEAVAAAQRKDPTGYTSTADAKLLAAARKLIFEVVPQDPTRDEYRQGDTLGSKRKHWFRAKFGSGRFRLFFRYSAKAKVLIFAWVNNWETLRTYDSKTDAYAVFRKMLDDQDPPDDWAELLAASSTDDAKARLQAAAPQPAQAQPAPAQPADKPRRVRKSQPDRKPDRSGRRRR